VLIKKMMKVMIEGQEKTCLKDDKLSLLGRALGS